MAKKNAELIAAQEQQLTGISVDIERVSSAIALAYLAAADADRPPDVAKLKAELAALRTADEDRTRTIVELKKRAEAEEAAAVVKRKAALIGRVETMCIERAKLGSRIEKKIGELLDLVEEKVEHDKRIIPAWPWSNSDREVLKPFSQGTRELLAYEFFKQCATRYLSQTVGAFLLPGSVCEKDIWRLQPHLIPSLSDRLSEIAEYASRTMRGGQPVTESKLEKIA
jgi:hypothetical protein